jgi:hypothetical protein
MAAVAGIAVTAAAQAKIDKYFVSENLANWGQVRWAAG